MIALLQLFQRLNSPPKQTLTVLQPTPSTVQFTVSTRPVPKGLPALISYYVSILFRILIGGVTIAAVVAKWQIHSAGYAKVDAFAAWGDAWIGDMTARAQWRFLLPVVITILYLVLRRSYTEESLLVLHGLGLQTSTTSSIYLRTPTTRFIPTTSVQDIFIHEAFRGFEVRFYLAVVVKGEEDVVVVFPRLLPRRGMLETVWRVARGCVYGGDGGRGKDRGGQKGEGSVDEKDGVRTGL